MSESKGNATMHNLVGDATRVASLSNWETLAEARIGHQLSRLLEHYGREAGHDALMRVDPDTIEASDDDLCLDGQLARLTEKVTLFSAVQALRGTQVALGLFPDLHVSWDDLTAASRKAVRQYQRTK